MRAVVEIAKKPAEFLRTTGVNYASFTIMWEKVTSYVSQFKEQTLSAGAGAKAPFAFPRCCFLP